MSRVKIMSKIKFDAAGRPCQLAYIPPGETRWTPTPDGVLVEFCGKGCTVKSAAQLVSWADVAQRANGNPDFAAPWIACLASPGATTMPTKFIISQDTLIAAVDTDHVGSCRYGFNTVTDQINANHPAFLVNARAGKVSAAKKWAAVYGRMEYLPRAAEIRPGEFLVNE